MRTKVGGHKGFDIFFDSHDEKFHVEGYDHSSDKKRSYNACKTYINSFIKENQLFGQFQIVKIPNERDYDNYGIVTVKGIHSNGNFLCESENGKRFQISTGYKYEMEKWCLPEDLEKSEYDKTKVDNINKQISKLRDDIKEEEKKLPRHCTEVFLNVKKEFADLWK